MPTHQTNENNPTLPVLYNGIKATMQGRPQNLYIKKEWCIRVLEHPVRVERQEHNRYRFWAPIEEIEGRYLRVVTLDDKLTIHNAFPDRSYKP